MRQIILFLFLFLFNKTNCETEIKAEKCDHSSECDENVLTTYLAEIELTCPESLIQQSIVNLEAFCGRVYEQLGKFRKYLKTCIIRDEHDMYLELVKGVKALHKKLCDDPDFSRRFALYYPCIHELRNDFENCNGPVDWYEEKDETQLCRNYKQIVDCFYIKTAKVCGMDAAKALKELTTEVVNSILAAECSDVAEDPDVKDPMPASYLCGKAETLQHSIKIITTITFWKFYVI